MPKEKLEIEELRKLGLIHRNDTDTTSIFRELYSDIKPCEQIKSQDEDITEQDLSHVGETIPQVGIVNVGIIDSGGMGIVYLGIQHPINCALIKNPELSLERLRKEFFFLGEDAFSLNYGISLVNRLYACKYLRENRKGSNSQIARFEREGKVLLSLSHPQVSRAIYADKRVVVTVFFPHTKTLDKIIEDDSRNTRERFEIVKDAIRISAEMYVESQSKKEAPLLHRDIKPRNILAFRRGIPDLSAFLIDFGLAGVSGEIERSTSDPRITQDDRLEGTPPYMPPEIFSEGMRSYTEKSEVYAFGATLYHALTGQPPFTGSNPFEVIMKIGDWLRGYTRGPRFPTELNPEVPKNLSEIVMRAMSKNPNDRPENTRELYDRLTSERFDFPKPKEPTSTQVCSMPTLVYELQQTIRTPTTPNLLDSSKSKSESIFFKELIKNLKSQPPPNRILENSSKTK